jgi:hypothetical protein
VGRADKSWDQSSAWDEAAQALFWAKLRRVRRFKGASAKSKAGWLWATGDPELRAAARQLLQQARAEGIPLDDLQEARFALDEGDLGPAEKIFRKARDRLSLAEVLVRSGAPAKQREARKLFEAWHRGDAPTWDELLPELVPEDFDDFDLLADLLGMRYQRRPPKFVPPEVTAAHGELVDALRRFDLSAVETLDRARWRQSYPGMIPGLHMPMALRPDDVGPLGAFLGKVAVRALRGRLVARTPLARTTVRVGRRALDVFRHAYDAVFLGVRAGAIFDLPPPAPWPPVIAKPVTATSPAKPKPKRRR